MNQSDFITALANPKNCIKVNKNQLKKHGVKKTIFLAFMYDYQQSPKNNDKEDKSFHLTIREIGSLTGMTIHQIKACIKYWKEQGGLDVFEARIFPRPYKTYYKVINLNNGGF